MNDAIEKAREAAARAIMHAGLARMGKMHAADPDREPGVRERHEAAVALNAALASLKASGLVIVPVEPTEGMVQAWAIKSPAFKATGAARQHAREVYAAMIAASWSRVTKYGDRSRRGSGGLFMTPETNRMAPKCGAWRGHWHRSKIARSAFGTRKPVLSVASCSLGASWRPPVTRCAP